MLHFSSGTNKMFKKIYNYQEKIPNTIYVNCVLKLTKLDMNLKYTQQYPRAIKITPEGTTQSDSTLKMCSRIVRKQRQQQYKILTTGLNDGNQPYKISVI